MAVRNGKDLEFDNVSSVTPAGEEMTYDMEISNYHNFFANGFLVHNSSGGGVFIKTPEGKPQYIGMVTRGSGETFNLIVPIRRIMQFAKTNKIEWSVDPKVAMPTEAELLLVPVEGMLKVVEKKADVPTLAPALIPATPIAPHAADKKEIHTLEKKISSPAEVKKLDK